MTSPRLLLKGLNLRPKKQLGQNFLADPSTARMIITRTGLSSDDIVFEIGAGLGALTIPASQAVKQVYAIEKDLNVASLLKKELRSHDITNVHVENRDIFNVDIHQIAAKEKSRLVVLGNLPYNISSQVLFYMIDARNLIDRAVLMFQKELAQRLLAGPGTKDYGRLSVMLQYYADMKKVASVAAHLFLPKPKIDSEVLEICFKKTITDPVEDENLFSEIVKAAFGKRRKTLKNALAGSDLNMDSETAGSVLESVGINPSRRAETLSISEFVALENAVYKIRKHINRAE